MGRGGFLFWESLDTDKESVSFSVVKLNLHPQQFFWGD